MDYEAPELIEYGSIEALTQQTLVKSPGANPDILGGFGPVVDLSVIL